MYILNSFCNQGITTYRSSRTITKWKYNYIMYFKVPVVSLKTPRISLSSSLIFNSRYALISFLSHNVKGKVYIYVRSLLSSGYKSYRILPEFLKSRCVTPFLFINSQLTQDICDIDLPLPHFQNQDMSYIVSSDDLSFLFWILNLRYAFIYINIIQQFYRQGMS